MLSVSSPLASAAEREASRCRLQTTLLLQRSFQVVKPAQAGALTTPLLESCRAAAPQELRQGRSVARSCWRRARRSWRIRPARCVGLSKLRCNEGLGGKTQQGICYLRIYVALASALPRRAASRAAVVTAFRRAAAILESTSEEVSTVDCRARRSAPRR